MIMKIGTAVQLASKAHLIPAELLDHIAMNVHILDKEYGVERDIVNDDGGYVVLLEDEVDLQDFISEGTVDFSYHVPEWVNLIKTHCGDFGSALFLTSNDYGIVLIAPIDLIVKLPNIQDCLPAH